MTFTAVKAHLVQLQTELNERIGRIEQEQKQRNEPDNDQWSDQGSLHERDDEQFALTVAAKAELNQVNDALIRIENNSYGICEVCGEEISAERLSILPYANRCIKHAD